MRARIKLNISREYFIMVWNRYEDWNLKSARHLFLLYPRSPYDIVFPPSSFLCGFFLFINSLILSPPIRHYSFHEKLICSNILFLIFVAVFCVLFFSFLPFDNLINVRSLLNLKLYAGVCIYSKRFRFVWIVKWENAFFDTLLKSFKVYRV